MAVDSSWSASAPRHRFDDTLAVHTRECLLELLQAGGADGICPTDVARALAERLGVDWRDLMRPVRVVAVELAREGAIEVRQNGEHVDILAARGPLRLYGRRR